MKVVFCHGLEGSSKAGYVRGLARELRARGLGAVALNFRSCSGEPNRLPRFYHSGDTGDLAFVIERLRAEQPGRVLGLAGFSLGGNVVAKYLGERGDAVPPEVRAGAVVSVPFDLALCARNLDGPDLMARVYRERFLRRLRAKVLLKSRRFPTLPTAAAQRARTFREFDEAVTAPPRSPRYLATTLPPSEKPHSPSARPGRSARNLSTTKARSPVSPEW